MNIPILSLAEHGLSVVPILPNGKAPGDRSNGLWRPMRGWRTIEPDQRLLRLWDGWIQQDKAGVGIRTGKIVGVDLDALDPVFAVEAKKMLEGILGATPLVRIGRAPKQLLVFRTEVPLRKLRSSEWLIDGKKCALEILGEGQQFVAYGTHPNTGKPYRWIDQDLATTDLGNIPVVQPAQLVKAVEMFDDLADLMGGELQARGSSALDDRESAEPAGSLSDLRAALGFIPNDVEHYDTWLRVGIALKRALPEEPDEAFELFDQWSSRSGKHDPETTLTKWETIDLDDRSVTVGARTLYMLARENGWDGKARPEDDFDKVTAEEAGETVGARGASIADRLRPISQVKPQLERRRLIKGLLPLRGTGWVYGHPGSRKSQIALDMAFAVAAGEPWLGRKTVKRAVVYSSAEGVDDLDNRVEAVRLARGASSDLPLILLPGGFRLVEQAKEFRTALRALQGKLDCPIGLFIFDTLFAHAPGKDVSAQNEMTQLTGVMHAIGDEFGGFTLGIHHKPSGADKMFGSVALGADADVVLEVMSQGQDRSDLFAEKLRGDQGQWTEHFAARVHSFGVDEDGDPVTAPYVEASTASAEQDFADLAITPAERQTLEALATALRDHGRPLGAQTVVEGGKWRKCFEDRNADHRSPLADPGSSFRKYRSALVRKLIVEEVDKDQWVIL